MIELPLTDGVIRFTPVNAAGERGETVELDVDELLAMKCSVDPRGSALGPWLFAPLMWIGLRTRRRRRRS